MQTTETTQGASIVPFPPSWRCPYPLVMWELGYHDGSTVAVLWEERRAGRLRARLVAEGQRHEDVHLWGEARTDLEEAKDATERAWRERLLREEVQRRCINEDTADTGGVP